MKASLTLREDPKPPILKAKIPLTIFGFPFSSGIEAGDLEELCVSFSAGFGLGPLLKVSYRPNDSRRPFGLSLKNPVAKFGSQVSVAVEFGSVDVGRPGFLLRLKSRSGDFSVRRSVESPMLDFFSRASESLPIENAVVLGEKMSWDRLFSGVCGALLDGEVRARTSVTVNRAAMTLGWSVRLPPECGGGSGGETLLKDLPRLVLRQIAIEHVSVKEKRHDSGRESDNVAGPRREVASEKSRGRVCEEMDKNTGPEIATIK